MIDDKEYKQILIEGIVHEKKRRALDNYKRYESILTKITQYGLVNLIIKGTAFAIIGTGVGTGVVIARIIGMYFLWLFRNSQDKCVKQCKSGTEKKKCYWKCYNVLEKRIITTIKKEINDTSKIKNPEKRKEIKDELKDELNIWEKREKKSRNKF